MRALTVLQVAELVLPDATNRRAGSRLPVPAGDGEITNASTAVLEAAHTLVTQLQADPAAARLALGVDVLSMAPLRVVRHAVVPMIVAPPPGLPAAV